ncbi:uncharacterized protein J3R85_008393 [Psidium guajava]|nr:uncharacterized protein J3R85_008393 [Psidium guajava]
MASVLNSYLLSLTSFSNIHIFWKESSRDRDIKCREFLGFN